MKQVLRYSLVALAGSLIAVPQASAQQTLSPDDGGMTVSMGQPVTLKPQAGLSLGGYFEDDASEFTAYLNAGIRKDLLTPVAMVGALMLEGYGGVRGSEIDGGARFLYFIPAIWLSLGVDWNFRDGNLPFMLRASIPFRRGGVIARGGLVTIDWLPARGNSFNFGFGFPIGQKWAGKTRPNHMAYPVSPDLPDLEPVPYADPALDPVLANVRETSYWVNRLTVPYFDQTARRRDQAVAAFTEDTKGIRARLASSDPMFGGAHGAEAETRALHAEVARAFSIAISGEDVAFGQATPAGEAAAEMARAVLLEEVLLPYDRLLGVYKKDDTTNDLAFAAMQTFIDWAESSASVPADRVEAVRYVFQAVLDEVESARAQAKEWWGDDRLVWLPLQYGLLPEEHDTQAELDALIERATGNEFSEGNSASYALGLQFQWELYMGIQRAEDYHVLWIHDYVGKNKAGEADLVAFHMTMNYVRTLANRVREYDSLGRMPSYFIFIDQHYYQLRATRMWLTFLEKPLDHMLKLPDGSEWMADSLVAVQAELREAVEGSERLQEGLARYGEKWLKNRVKVHVSVTNPADVSYWANSYIPLRGWPDNAIRDHRKIAFYDITEEDPYRGSATFSGMGVAEHYVGPNWEDRALVLEGPAALEVKGQARALLESQGFDEDQIPEPLRARPLAEDYWEKVEDYGDQFQGGARAIQLHNGTGYLMKPINVMKAILYTLMPPGAVIIDPDSLFHNPLWASMLTGSALRGVRVFIIHPSQRNAPGQAFATLSRANEMFERLLIAEHELAAELEAAGGVLKSGLYDTDVAVTDLPGRVQLIADGFRSTPWLREILPAGPELMSVLDSADQIYAEAVQGREVEYLSDELEGKVQPMLHLKTNFFMTGEVVDMFLQHPAFADFARAFMVQQSLDVISRTDYRDVRELNLTLADQFFGMLDDMREEYGPELAERSVAYFMVGSSNQDYRSMMMDGEAAVALAHRAALNGFFDSIGIAAASTYLDSVEQLNDYLPYYTGFTWKMARWVKVAL